MRRAISRMVLACAVALGVVTGICQPVPTADAATPALRWTALGDSYSAGVGLGVVDPPCDRDAGAYALLADQQLASSGYSTTRFTNFACSGALSQDYWAANSGQPPQRDFIASTDNVVTMTLGGNDIYFADKAAGCVFFNCGPDVWELSASNSESNTHLSWDAVYKRLVDVYTDVRSNRQASTGHLFVLSYPIPFALGGGDCGVFTYDEQLALNALATRLDDTINLAVQEANRRIGNVHFVDWRTGTRVPNLYQIPDGYKGAGTRYDAYLSPNGLCGSEASFINDLQPGYSTGVIPVSKDNSLHPNEAGYGYAAGRLAAAVRSALPEITDTGGGAPPPSRTVTLQRGAAKASGYWYSVTLSGYPANTRVPVRCHDSVDPSGFVDRTISVGASGVGIATKLCYSGDGPDHWVTSLGYESNHVRWGPGAPPEGTGYFNGSTWYEFDTHGCSFVYQVFDVTYASVPAPYGSGPLHMQVCVDSTGSAWSINGAAQITTSGGSTASATATGTLTDPGGQIDVYLTPIDTALPRLRMVGTWRYDPAEPRYPGVLEPVDGTLAIG